MEEKPPRKIYYIVAILFLLFLAGGYVFGLYTDYAAQILGSSFGFFEGLKNSPPYILMFFIFLNNSLKALFAILLGVFFGLFPLYFLAVNAFIIGIAAAFIAKASGALLVLAGLLPHGILEIPAILLAIVYGLWIGASFIRSLKNGKSINNIINYSVKNYFRIIVPVLLAAALIEAYLTPKLMNLVVK